MFKIFIALNILSECFGFLRFAFPEYFAFFCACKMAMDMPKECLKANPMLLDILLPWQY